MNDNRQPARVVLFCGVIKQSIRQTAAGIFQDLTHLGENRFFIDVIDDDGDLLAMWDGASYEQAILAAEELGRDFGLPVRDEVVGAAA